jgi:hypothetical protein
MAAGAGRKESLAFENWWMRAFLQLLPLYLVHAVLQLPIGGHFPWMLKEPKGGLPPVPGPGSTAESYHPRP